jgi:[protein-PII] uridylyltransferase
MTPKEFFKQEYDAVFRYHRCGGGGAEVCAELSELVDRTLTMLWSDLPEDGRSTFAVVALGGYGRYEMAPHSDVDLMLLFADEETKLANVAAAQKFLHSLWSLNFDIGHSVRTVQDCLNLYQTDVDVWASVLESRFVCGSDAVMERYSQAMMSTLRSKQDLKFIASVIAGVDERHVKYDHSVKLLEPNLKNSAGGIRDIHSLLWIYRSADPSFFGDAPFRVNSSAGIEMIEQFKRIGIIPEGEYGAVVRAFDFLLRMRNETHYAAASQQDTLEFTRQSEIAKGLGYTDDDPIRSVERCMRDYFLHARSIYRLNRRLLQRFRKSATRTVWSFRKEQVLDDRFVVRDGQLHLRNAAVGIDSPVSLMKAFYFCGVHSLELSPSIQSIVDSMSGTLDAGTMTDAERKEIGRIFIDILSLPTNVAAALQMMNDGDLLGAYIAEWGDLVAFFQHSMYHYYTADAHTLIALEHAENLSGRRSVLGDVYRGLQNKAILYLAILFHDIAKPHGVQGHEVAGAAMWKKIQERFNFADEHDDVAFLIRNHLAMEQIAFRRNTADPQTVEEFAKLFRRPEQLDLLFVLTYCDLSAVNKNVWSNWKETLLQELYLRTKRLLRKESGSEPDPLPENIAAHIAAIGSPRYAAVFSHGEIEEHIAAIGGENLPAMFVRNGTAYTLVTVVTHDAQYLLSTLCGLFAANDVNIIEANIFTRNDGIAIDQFRVVNAATRSGISADQEEKLRNDLAGVIRNRETLDHLFERHRKRWRRRAKPLFHPNIRIDVVFHESDRHTIMDVYAPDMTGFLYKITQTISKQGLQISYAKLATRGDGIVDSFTISEYGGKKISNREQTLLREKILHTISQLIGVQMSET